ncbi:hypothetical protein [Xenorhabdus siamensis]|uniref:hypothetical protein n=1 Tax=Xenorhabdus siamensis TaxID=3136254 RepID=UPI0030F4B292
MIEDILQDAIKYAKRFFGNRTTNKFYPDLSVLPESERSIYQRNVIVSRMDRHNKIRLELYNLKDINQKHQYLLSNEHNNLVGNCPELCLATYIYLIKERAKDIWELYNASWNYEYPQLTCPIYIQQIYTLGVYDHVFLLLDHPDSLVRRPKIGTIYHELPEGSWVCDPWADIVCLAEDYNDRWKHKMMEWNHQGMCLLLKSPGSSSPSAESFSPLKKYTYLTVECSDKQVYRLSAIYRDGQVETFN